MRRLREYSLRLKGWRLRGCNLSLRGGGGGGGGEG